MRPSKRSAALRRLLCASLSCCRLACDYRSERGREWQGTGAVSNASAYVATVHASYKRGELKHGRVRPVTPSALHAAGAQNVSYCCSSGG